MQKNILESLDYRELGTRLKQARQKKGMTQADAAAILDVARTTLTAIEQGSRRIQAGELIKLSRAYGQQVSDFVRAMPETIPFQVQFRGARFDDVKDSDQFQESIALFESYCQNYLALEEITGGAQPFRYPQTYKIDGMQVDHIAEAIAIEERNRLGAGDGPIPQLREMLENDIGLRIFYLPLRPTDKISALYAYDSEIGGCIAVNVLHPEERRRWSLAHKYAHFLTEREKAEILPTGGHNRVSQSERFADAFARYFLMPTSGLIKRARARLSEKRQLTVADILILANYYAVSVEAMTHRLEELGLTRLGTWLQIQERRIPIRQAQHRLGLEPVTAHSDTFPKRYLVLAIDAYEQGIITEGQLARFLNVDRLQARRIIEDLRQTGNEGDSELEAKPEHTLEL
jgi:Zn-dependent peptidase ImmA (M78 family)/DNA-binding XRE family transcriptional regulator